MLSITCWLLVPLSSLWPVTPSPVSNTPSQEVLQLPSLYFRLNPLTFTATLPAVNVRMFPNVPNVAESPSKVKVPGIHVGAGVGVGVGVHIVAAIWPRISPLGKLVV